MNSSTGRFSAVFSILILFALVSGCSSSDVLTPEPVESERIDSGRNAESVHNLLAYVHLIPDVENLEIMMVPRRSVEMHFNVKGALTPPNCTGCIEFHVNSFNSSTRIMDVDVTLKNPTNLTGYDVRGILIANNTGHEMRNPDDWTKLYDDGILPDINPFKAFEVNDPNRQFNSFETDMQKVLFHLPLPPNWGGFDYAVDASWPGHCKEPYEIVNFVQADLIPKLFDTTELSVDVHDWQDDVTEVTIDVTPIMGEVIQLTNTLGETWSADVANYLLPPPGVYSCLVSAYSPNGPGWWLYDYVNVLINEPDYQDRITFASDRTGNWDIFMMNPDGSNQTQLTFHPGDDTNPAFSPNELKLIFQTDRDSSPTVKFELYTYDILFEMPYKETSECEATAPAWSASDEIIYLTSYANCINIVTYHPAHFTLGSPDVTHVPLGPLYDGFVNIKFNGDGSKVIFSASFFGVFVFEADFPDFTTVEQLTTYGSETYASYSPDETMIAYSSTRESNIDIYIMDLATSAETRLTFDPDIDEQPTWSPDSKMIAYVHYFDDLGARTSIYVVSVDGSTNIDISQNDDSSDINPDWSGNIFG